MYTGMLHTHKLVVSLFLLHYLIKTILLVINSGALEKYTKKTKVPEMIISVLFLATGIFLALNKGGDFDSMFWVKLLLVFGSIPLAIIGFKKGLKPLAIVSVLFILGAYGIGESLKHKAPNIVVKENISDEEEETSGEDIYSTYCIACHGAEGKAGNSGAKDLSVSILTQEEKVEIITNGKGQMTSYAKVLSKEEIESVATYIETLKK